MAQSGGKAIEKWQVYGTVTVPGIEWVLYIAPGDVYAAPPQHFADCRSVADGFVINVASDEFILCFCG
jgi:hypothetical protein